MASFSDKAITSIRIDPGNFVARVQINCTA